MAVNVIVLVVWILTLNDPHCCLSTCLCAAGDVERDNEWEAVYERARCEHKKEKEGEEGGGEQRELREDGWGGVSGWVFGWAGLHSGTGGELT